MALVGRVALIAAAACVPLPIPHSERETPAISGAVVREDGTVATGRVIGVREVRFNRSCRAPRARATTDSLGRFLLPAASGHESIFWLTLMESFDLMPFGACEIASGTSGDSVVAETAHIMGTSMGTTLACLEWSWRDSLRLACTSNRQYRGDLVTNGGTWRAGTDSGQYRVIRFDDAHCSAQQRVVVQWLADAPRVPHPVRATRELEGPKRCLPDGPVAFDQIGDTTIVRLSALNGKALAWSLGPPGVVARRERQ